MSEQLRHKMIDFEAMPPHAAWDSIAARLDDDKQYAALTNLLNNFETPPPSAAWQAIAERINDDKQYAAVTIKMNDFEATPPFTAWEAIAERLNDDKQYNTVATKMDNFAATPPPQIWNKIAASLPETKEIALPAINIRRTLYRVAAAAIVIGLFVGGWMFINKNEPKIEVVKNTSKAVPIHPETKKENNSGTPVNPAQKGDIVSVQQHGPLLQDDDNSHMSSSDAYTDNNHILKYAIVNNLPSYQERPIIIHSSPILDKNGNVIRDMDVLTTNNYIMVTGPNGQETRISSKFASVIRYLNGSGNSDDTEEYLDIVIKESDTWKKRFQEWRNKISQSSFIPSASNFLDIIEFKELIQEKQ